METVIEDNDPSDTSELLAALEAALQMAKEEGGLSLLQSTATYSALEGERETFSQVIQALSARD